MTDVPLPGPGDPSWSDWGQDEEETSDQIHAATASPTVSTLMKRDAAGRAQVVDGTAAADIATKGQLDGKVPTTRTISTTAPLTGGGDLSANRTLAVSAATDTAAGVVELATTAEATTGTDTARAVTPAGVKAVADTKLGIVTGSGLADTHKVSQATYDGLGAGRPSGRIYFIV